METPSPEDVRGALAAFDARGQKIIAGLFGVMVQNPGRVREREWIAQQLTEVTLLAGDFEAESPHAGVRAVQEFLQENSTELLNASFLLFHRVALDLQPRATQGFEFDEVMQRGLEYLPGEAEPG